LIVRAEIHEAHIGAFHKSSFLQPTVKAVELIRPQLLLAAVENTDNGHRLLAVRNQRDNNHTTSKAEEFTPTHSLSGKMHEMRNHQLAWERQSQTECKGAQSVT
jgi:hypothetical protein